MSIGKVAGMIDRELLNLARAVRDGSIQDQDQVRNILNRMRDDVDRRDQRLCKLKCLLCDAEEAFLIGWTNSFKKRKREKP